MGKYFLNAIIWALSILFLSFLTSYAFAYVFLGCWVLLPLIFFIVKALKIQIFINWSYKRFGLTYLLSLLFCIIFWFGLVTLFTVC